jgi:hypothetical protein
MATVVPFDSSGPEFRVFVDSEGQLDLGNVSRFLQRLDTAARYTARTNGVPTPSIQIVSLTTGSLDVKLKLQDRRRSRVALAISAASLALGVASYLKYDPAAARACKALIEGDNATVILVDGGGRQEEIKADDLDAAEEQQVAAAGTPDYELLTGPQTGFVRYLGGEYWVELDARPGLIIRIRDQREERKRLEENARYTLDGEAHISAPRRGESFFLLQHALMLE